MELPFRASKLSDAHPFCIVIGIYLAPKGYFVFDNFRISLSNEKVLPKDNDIVLWGGDGFFQSDLFFYLIKTKESSNEKIWEVIGKNDQFFYLAKVNCKGTISVLSGEYRLISSNCG